MTVFYWAGGSGDMGVASNWRTYDSQGTLTVATAVPGAGDQAEIELAGTLLDSATVSQLNIDAAVAIDAITTVGTYALVGNTASGSVTVNAATWTENGTLVVGSGASGALTISGGGLVADSREITIGAIAGAGGSLLIGAASTLDTGGTFDWIGNVAGAQGSATLDGAGARWNIAAGGYLIVGNFGTGTLGIGAGASLVFAGAPLSSNYDAFDIGENQGGSGAVTLNGAAALLDAGAGAIGVGLGGFGTLLVENGATVLASAASYPAGYYAFFLGYAPNGVASGSGVATIDGTGSVLKADGVIAVADSEAGTLTVSNNATVAVTASSEPDYQPNIMIGVTNGATGVVSVTSGGVLDAGSGALAVGMAGTGTLVVQGGTVLASSAEYGTLEGALVLGWNLAATPSVHGPGVMTVDGAGALVKTSGMILVGQYGAGTLSISNQATVEATGTEPNGFANVIVGLSAGASGSVDVSGTHALLDAGPALVLVGDYGQGTLAVTQGGTVLGSAAQSLGTQQVAGIIGYGATGAGSVTIDGAGSTLAADGQVVVGQSGAGTLVVSNAGQASVGGTNDGGLGLILDASGGTGDVQVNAGTLLVSDNAQVNAAGTLAASNGGSIDIGGNLTLAPGGTLADDATAFVQIGTDATVAAGSIAVDVGHTLAGAGVIAGALANNGVVDVSGGTLVLRGPVAGNGTIVVEAGGTLEEDAAIGAGQTIILEGGSTLDLALPLTGGVQSFDLAGTVDVAAGDAAIAVNGLIAGSSATIANGASLVVSVFLNGTTSQETINVTGLAAGAAPAVSGNDILLDNRRLIYAAANGLDETDGTAAGTTVITPTATGFKPGAGMATLNNSKVVFAASANGTSGAAAQYLQLWTSDGTAGGTTLLKTFADNTPAGSYGDFSGLSGFRPIGDRVVFNYFDGSNAGTQLWVTDGTAAGTYQLPNSTDAGMESGDGAVIGTELIYAAANGLDETDGTAAGTTVITPTATGFKPGAGMATLNNSKVVFAASANGTSGAAAQYLQLWTSDGTAGGTTLLKTFADNTPAGSYGDFSGLSGFRPIGDRVVFNYFDGSNAGTQLWVTDGTAAGTYQLPNSTDAGMESGDGAVIGTELIYAAANGLDETDGTAAGTTVITPTATGFKPGAGMATLNNSKVVFAASANGTSGAAAQYLQLWTSDGTAGGTTLLKTFADNTPAGSYGDFSGLSGFRPIGDRVVFNYFDGSNAGTQLWVTDGTAAGTYQLPNSNDAAVGNGEDAVLPCYAAGTRIATDRGEVAVERLRPGDRALTLGAGTRPVRWIGHARIDLARHAQPWAVAPVRVRAGAIAEGVPSRDLLLSPDHAVFLDGVLMPVRVLLNGATIVQEAAVGRVTYYHVELDAHDVLLAEGLPAESYLDTGNRAAFANGGAVRALHPDFSAGVWDERGCAKLLLEGARVVTACARLRARAEALGYALTPEPDLRVLADGTMLRPLESAPGRWRFALPAQAHRVRLLSRVIVPQHLDRGLDDLRRLGIALTGVALDGRAVALDSPMLDSGFHAPEGDCATAWRWTDGDAVLRLPRWREARALELRAMPWLRYWSAPAERVAPRRPPARFSVAPSRA